MDCCDFLSPMLHRIIKSKSCDASWIWTRDYLQRFDNAWNALQIQMWKLCWMFSRQNDLNLRYLKLYKILHLPKLYNGVSFLKSGCDILTDNPLTPIGSPVTHESWPMNWPNFAASPALLGWPARNRHTAACIHRFSHILRWPPEPVVWFMSESRAVANEHEGHKRTLPIISSSFWMTVGVKGIKKTRSLSQVFRNKNLEKETPAYRIYSPH